MSHEIKPSKLIVLKNIKENTPNASPEGWWFKVLLRFGSFATRNVPHLRRFIINTSSGMEGRACRMLAENRYEEAFSLCTEALPRFRNNTGSSAHTDWWQFMGYATFAADKLNDVDKKAQLVSAAEDGFPPFEGNPVAYSLCFFARWRGAAGDHEGAIEYANRAKGADETYAEAHAVIGMASLIVNGSDPIEHFRNAIKHDIRYLRLITSEPLVQKYPHIVRELKKLSLREVRTSDGVQG